MGKGSMKQSIAIANETTCTAGKIHEEGLEVLGPTVMGLVSLWSKIKVLYREMSKNRGTSSITRPVLTH